MWCLHTVDNAKPYFWILADSLSIEEAAFFKFVSILFGTFWFLEHITECDLFIKYLNTIQGI